MARILFFIGNGFDLNIGLKTGYKHFYGDFVKSHPDNIIAKEIMVRNRCGDKCRQAGYGV